MDRDATNAAIPLDAPEGGIEGPWFHELSGCPQLDASALRKLAEDPEKARQIAAAQKRIFEHMERMAEILAKDLAQYQDRKNFGEEDATTGASLKALSRKGEPAAKARLELARDLLVASVINYGNRDWNPADPSTGWSAERNPSTLLSLILLGPVELAGGDAGLPAS